MLDVRSCARLPEPRLFLAARAGHQINKNGVGFLFSVGPHGHMAAGPTFFPASVICHMKKPSKKFPYFRIDSLFSCEEVRLKRHSCRLGEAINLMGFCAEGKPD